MTDQVVIPHNDRYQVAISKDHNKGLVIQVLRQNPSHVRTDNGTMYVGHVPVVMHQVILTLVDSTGIKSKQKLREELFNAVSVAKKIVNECAVNETMIDELMQEYESGQ